MPRQRTINNVPDSEVADTKGDFERDGAAVVVTPNGDGTSTVVATYPRRRIVDKVPASGMAATRRDFEMEGATVVATPNDDGTWKLVATYPD